MNNSVISASAVVATVSDLNMKIRGVGDINGDGRSDILWRNQVTGDNAVWLMNGTTLTQGLSLPSATDLGMTMAGIGDFDGNGKSGDIFWRKPSTGETAVWLMNGATYLKTEPIPVNPATDRLTGRSYDASGNVAVDGVVGVRFFSLRST